MFYEIAEKALALEAKGRKIIRLNVGDTNLPTPACAIEAAERKMNEGKSGYVSSAGLQEFREAIAKREKCQPENVVVGAGSKHLIFALLSVLGTRGAKVAFPSPHWPAYALACRQLGLKSETVSASLEGKWQPDALPQDAGIAIICNPLNPTSTIYGESWMRKALSQAEKRETHVILDEAYRGIAFEGIPQYKGAICVRSFSKEFNMENWRLGYLVAPEEVAEKVVAFNQITETCVPPFVQAAGIACLENEKELLEANRKTWKARMNVASKAMKEAGFEFAEPQAGMYIFATHDGVGNADEYAMELLEEGVAVAPGGDFGSYPKFVRICANRPEGVLEAAIEKMGEAAK